MAQLGAIPARPSRLPCLEEVQGWIGWRVDDINGSMVGEVERLCHDDAGAPTWLVVREYHLDEGRRFVIPAADAVGSGGRVWSPHPRERIRMTSKIAGTQVSPQAEGRLRAHYRSERHAA